MSEKPFDLRLFAPPYGETLLEKEVESLTEAFSIIAQHHYDNGAVAFHIIHRDTADSLVTGSTHSTPNAIAYERKRRNAAFEKTVKMVERKAKKAGMKMTRVDSKAQAERDAEWDISGSGV